ncbi:hypothetical protein GCM10027445_69030 [Amycolatopsis endophytica]|uniref:Uncharacterized protein n=1 Tax=Amycolatopsis endophytica TaxID=860233 RepID=A0A853B403_9PSEU|nr:hypothetical protein [Amycolatopsis endophytica]NYI89739.1 hypothetical protein [Amycolatopsis endophytica]
MSNPDQLELHRPRRLMRSRWFMEISDIATPQLVHAAEQVILRPHGAAGMTQRNLVGELGLPGSEAVFWALQ